MTFDPKGRKHQLDRAPRSHGRFVKALERRRFPERGLDSQHASFGLVNRMLDKQNYVAYRADSDEIEVHFFGGPLDGTRIRTDVIPVSDTFLHRVRERNYVYRYRRVSKDLFDATLDSILGSKQP